MASKLYEGVLPKGCDPRGVGFTPLLKKELIEMLLKKHAAVIKKIKPKKDLDDHYEWEFYPEHEEMSHPPKPKLWYLIAVLKKTGISLEQVGDEMGLSFLGNVICQFKLLNPGSCNYVCFLYNYFQKVSPVDWPAKNAILEKLTKSLPKMKQTRRKAEKSFKRMVVGRKQWGLPQGVWGLPHCGVYPT